MKTKAYDFEKVCRACLKEEEDSNLKSIFEVKVSDEKQIRLTDFIRRMTSLKIWKNDGLPEQVCSKCVEKLCDSYDFSQTIIASDSELKNAKIQKLMDRELIHLDYGEASDEDLQFIELKNVVMPKEQTIEQEEIKQSNFNTQENNCQDFQQSIDKPLAENTDSNIKENENSDINNFYETFKADEDTKTDDDAELIDIVVESEDSFDEEQKSNQKASACYKCSECDEGFSSFKKLKKHEESHKGDKMFQCSECPRAFAKENSLVNHSKRHKTSEEKEYVCVTCGKKFLYQHLLKLHSYKHTDVKPFPCSKCDRGCTTAESLRRHMRIHEADYEKKKHICEICNREFPYKSFLAGHMTTHTNEKPFLCSLCGRGYRQSGALEYHMRTHSGLRPYGCSVCGKKFTSPGVLKVHMRSHTDERPYVCDICGMAFRQSTDMRSHRRIHTGEKPVLCPICGKRMSTTGQLTVHLRSHTGEKPYSCQTCTKSFTTKTMLTKHERIHTGDRPYVCKVCNKAFNQSTTLKTHMKRHTDSKNKQTASQEKLDLTQLVTDNNCIILDVNNAGETQIVRGQIVGQIDVENSDNVVLVPTTVPILQNL